MKHGLFAYIILFMFFPILVLAQYQSVPVKEEFDLYNADEVSEHYICTQGPSDYNDKGLDIDGNLFGDGMAKVLEGYIPMYKATGDKAYLYKFVLQSLCMMENRHDLNPAADNSHPRWARDPQMYQDGYIIAALSRFVYLVKIEMPILFNEPLYQFDELNPSNYAPNTCNCNKFGITFSTFGQYANWLQDRVSETLLWYLTSGYWSNSWGMLQVPGSNFTGAAMNMQVGFGRALLFTGLITGEQSFLDKAIIIANLYKSHIFIFDICEAQFYNADVLRLTNDNAYWWYHAGWSRLKRDCSPFYNVLKYSGFVKYVEDISHGAVDTWLPLDFYNFQPSTPFTTTDMIRFRNMFTKHIYDGSGGFYNAVDGTDNPLPNDPCDPNNCPHNYYASGPRKRPLNYMLFADFDGADGTATSPDVYDIVMNYYINNVQGSNTSPYAGQDNKGHAEVVQAQWERECPDLALYNRNVVYDQDFFAKNDLIVAPEQDDNYNDLDAPAYADPVTFTDNKFIIEPEVTVNMKAAHKIVLKQGFHAKAGSHFRAFIDHSLSCDNGNRLFPPGSDTEAEPSSLPVFTEAEKSRYEGVNEGAITLSVHPNPSSGRFTVEWRGSGSGELSIRNLFGQEVYRDRITAGSTGIDLSGQAAGMYFLSLRARGDSCLRKLLVR